MASSRVALSVWLPRSFVRRWRSVIALLGLACCLVGCAGSPIDPEVVDNLPPLRADGTVVTVADVAERIPEGDLLYVDDAMKEFVELYTSDQRTSRMRLMSLHRAVRGAGGLGMVYDPFAEGAAPEVFKRGTANCLSYANLFIALAREAGLEAHYQWVEVRPQWSRVNHRVQIGLHVNVVVRLLDGKRYMVDIDPLPSRDISGSKELTDEEGEALYYNNIAMAALGDEDLQTAWLYLVRSLQLSSDNAHLWANLGAVYRAAGQHREAEQSYLQALDLDFAEQSAMTNLAILYDLEGRDEERDRWMERVKVHRKLNPYYHAWLGDVASEEGDWEAALAHYDRALELAPNDSHLLFGRGIIFYQMNDYEAAAFNIQQAIALATLYSDIVHFRRQLDEVRKAQLAGV